MLLHNFKINAQSSNETFDETFLDKHSKIQREINTLENMFKAIYIRNLKGEQVMVIIPM